ncbi:Crp/Fnr family transcriptional regulator [Herpetosiphon llansteffanensis]
MMPIDGYALMARTFQQLAPIPPDQMQACLRLFKPRFLDAEQVWLHAGEATDEVGFLVDGLLRFYYLTADGLEWTKSFCMPGDLIGGYRALLLNEPCQFTIETLLPSHYLVAKYADFAGLINQHPCWDRLLRRVAEALFIKKEQRESSLLLDDATTRYQRFLVDFSAVAGVIKQYHIASYLGITPVSLSRIRRQLRPD